MGEFWFAQVPNRRTDLERLPAAILDAAAEAGLAALVCDKRAHWRALAAGADQARCGFEAALRDFGAHPAVFGFHAGDEPTAADFNQACRMLRLQKELAPQLTPFCNLFSWFPGAERLVAFPAWSAYLDAYVKNARPDLLCYDCYSQLNPADHPWGWDMYFRNLREYWEASIRAEVPYWTTLLSVGHFQYRCPTEDDLRWQINTAAAHGAKGLLWFFLYMREPHENYRVAPIDEHWERTETYERLSRVNRTFLKTHAPVLADLTLRFVGHVGTAWGGFTQTDGLGPLTRAVSKNKTPLIVSEFTDAAGRTYVAVVNNSQTTSTQAELRFRSSGPFLYRIGWEGVERKVDRGDGWTPTVKDDTIIIHPWLAPGQMELFRMDSFQAK